MPKLTPQDEKRLEEKFRLISMQSHEDEEKKSVKDYSLVIGVILLIIGLLFYTINIVLGGSLMAMGLAAIIYRFTPW